MRLLKFLLVLVVVVIAVGFFRGWFSASTTEAEGKKGVVFTWDKDKIKDDLSKATDKAKALGKTAYEKIKQLTTKKDDELEGQVRGVDHVERTITLSVEGKEVVLPVLQEDMTGLDELVGTDVKIKLEKTESGVFVRSIETK